VLEDGLRILLIDDEVEDRALVSLVLKQRFSPLEIEEVADAIGFARAFGAEFDLAVVAQKLAWSEGLTVLRALKERWPRRPVILLASAGGEAVGFEAAKLGAEQCLIKSPGTFLRLPSTLEAALERVRSNDDALRLWGSSEEEPWESEERYALAVRGANDGLWDWDLRSDKIYFSPRWKVMLGYGQGGEGGEGEIGTEPREWFERVHPEDRARVDAEISAHLAGRSPHFESEHRMLHRDGDYLWVLSRGIAVRDEAERAVRIAGFQTDITARKAAEERLQHNAFHDCLTGLPNRALFLDRVGVSIAHTKRRVGYVFAVVFLDVDRFKTINDSLGHTVGDDLLVAMARRLEALLRPGDTVARLGGDELAVLLDDLTEASQAMRVAERISREIELPFNLGGHEVFTTASLGIALSVAGDYELPEEVLRDADTAMYRAKASGRERYVVFQREMHESALALLQLENDLRQAIEREEFALFYQPIVSLATGRLDAFEALLRWRHPRRGLVHPEHFISLAEETGLIVPLGWWVLREACRQLSEWQALHPQAHPLAVSVNLSAKQFMQADLIQRVEQVLGETRIAPGSLRLEITESTILGGADTAIGKLLELRKLEVQLQIDDFGTGYSSLSELHRLPMDTLKIDRSLINSMTGRDECSEVVNTIVTLARGLRMNVTAEGLETEDQVCRLRNLSCQYGQGYFFSRPLESAAAGSFILSHVSVES
jgi:diguanylate cyclase (GGDEF)-like protein/PAS domain S-box-containing protein